MKPFLKWCGGKRQLLPELHKSIPEDFFASEVAPYEAHYYEPFVGGGALFFDLRARGLNMHATLGDANDLLVRTYLGVRNDVEAVIENLGRARYEKGFYLRERARHVEALDDTSVAAWFIYINKCGFNGLWRVNSKGGCNVPFGKYTNPTICNAEGLRAASKALKKTVFFTGDFERTVAGAESGDLVYFDPPYVPVNETANFTSYTKDGFTMRDQERLRDCFGRLRRRGVHVILSNADVPAVRKMYRDFNIRRVEARRNVNSKGGKRGLVGEVIIT